MNSFACPMRVPYPVLWMACTPTGSLALVPLGSPTLPGTVVPYTPGGISVLGPGESGKAYVFGMFDGAEQHVFKAAEALRTLKGEYEVGGCWRCCFLCFFSLFFSLH